VVAKKAEASLIKNSFPQGWGVGLTANRKAGKLSMTTMGGTVGKGRAFKKGQELCLENTGWDLLSKLVARAHQPAAPPGDR
jgi:hypothetical protein